MLGRGPGDDDTGRYGRDEGRYLRYQTVTDRQDRVSLRGNGDFHADLQDANAQTTQNVDECDQDAGDGIATHELARTVHRAVEICFTSDVIPSRSGLLLGDEPRVEVRVDAHLLARHRIQRESSGHFGHASRALRDHDELDDHDDEEDEKTQDVVAFDDELAKGVDDLACVGIAQNQSGCGDVEGEPEQRQDEEEPREYG